MDIDFENEPIGTNPQGFPIMLADIWPSRDEVARVVAKVVKPALFQEFYSNTLTRNQRWNDL